MGAKLFILDNLLHSSHVCHVLGFVCVCVCVCVWMGDAVRMIEQMGGSKKMDRESILGG